ncbi:hypothetical protein SEPCBS57363_004928 [Sporothrix epigloea]|uniref:Mitochondrial mRNA processing protein n=1 Tax=Sporothrix epigloea TaxID=1892477 RepID=A0ABP0DV10_9PEZI
MHQIARSVRMGWRPPLHFCTACISAFDGPPSAIWRTAQYDVRQQQSRNYAKASSGPSAESTPDATSHPDTGSETANKSAAAGSGGKKSRSAASQVAGRKNKKAAKMAARASQSGSVSQASQTQLKLWRETLDVLTKLEKAQGRLAEQASIATGKATIAMANDQDAAAEEKKGDETDGAKQTKHKKKKPMVFTEEQKQAALESAKEAQEQVKMLTSALHLLKTVLSTQAFQKQPENSSSKDERIDGKPGKNAKKKQKKKTEQTTVPNEDSADETAIAKSETTTEVPTAAPELSDGDSTPAADDATSVPVDKSTPTPTGGSKRSSSSKKHGAAKAGRTEPYRVNKVESRNLQLQPVQENIRPVPRLHYGLDRALFNPGVYHLQDPRSRVFNFDPYLASIMPLQEFDFNALKQYVTSSKDSTLISMARKYNMKYSGSTSSMTSLLSHFHFLLSSWRTINAAHTTRSFTPESMNFTRITRGPAATFLHHKDGVYAIDADKGFDTANILSMLGKSMEKLLTLPKEDFEKYRVTRSHELTEEERNDPESFHYTTFGDFMMRSQLDAHDARLPGTGMFDLKTRAVVSIRMDAQDFQRGLGYEIRNRFGQWESFEREYFDMIRSAFLKYSLQVRMGRMDGIYVAFHNTERIFGFQYISINEMDLALHGTENTELGDREFMLSLHLLNAVMDKATERFPDRSLRLHIETRPSLAAPFMYVFAKPVTPEEIAEVQDAGKESVEAFERNILGMTTRASEETAESDDLADAVAGSADADAETRERETDEGLEPDYDEDEESVSVWETMRQRVEETIENEAQGIATVRDTIEDALEQSGLLRGQSPEETRAYVDALLEAITRTDTEAVAETILKGQESAAEGEEMDVESDETSEFSNAQSTSDIQAEQEATELGASSAIHTSDNEAALPVDDISTSIIDEDGENSVMDSEVRSKDREVSGSESSSSPSLSSGALSLKDLIIKLAAKIETTEARDDATVGSATTTDSIEKSQDSPADTDCATDGAAPAESLALSSYNSSIAEIVEDAPQNKRFERILSALMASSKENKSSTKSTAASSSNSTSAPSPSSTSTSDSSTEPAEELLGMIVTIRNKVNGHYVTRPSSLSKSDTWTVEYAMEEIPHKRAQGLYEMLKKRRRELLSRDGKDGDNTENGDGQGGEAKKPPAKSAFNREFMNKLYAMSARGRRFRRTEDEAVRDMPLHVYGVDSTSTWNDVFGSGQASGSNGYSASEEEVQKAE